MSYEYDREEIVNYLYELTDHYWYWQSSVFGMGEDSIMRMGIFFELICLLTEKK